MSTETATKTPYQTGDGYKAIVEKQLITTNNFGDPGVQLTVRLTHKLESRYDPEGPCTELAPAYQAKQTIFLSFDPNSDRLKRTRQTLMEYGFGADDSLERLHPDHKNAFRLVGKTVAISCGKVNETAKGTFYTWYLNGPKSRSNRKAVALEDLQDYCESNKEAIESITEELTSEFDFPTP